MCCDEREAVKDGDTRSPMAAVIRLPAIDRGACHIQDSAMDRHHEPCTRARIGAARSLHLEGCEVRAAQAGRRVVVPPTQQHALSMPSIAIEEGLRSPSTGSCWASCCLSFTHLARPSGDLVSSPGDGFYSGGARLFVVRRGARQAATAPGKGSRADPRCLLGLSWVGHIGGELSRQLLFLGRYQALRSRL